MDINSWVGIAGLLGFFIAAGSLLGLSIRVGRNTSTVNNYRESALSWEAKSKAQESEIADLQNANAALEMQINGLKAKQQVLEELVTGKAAIEALSNQILTVVSGMKSALVNEEVARGWYTDLSNQLASLRTIIMKERQP
ncbi:MAG: hypothetical protein ACYCOU_14750 [Sulfobacillus sp.]